jgi:hypothetical protein
MQCFRNALTYIATVVSYTNEMLMKLARVVKIEKHFMCPNNGPREIRCNVSYMCFPMQCFQNATAYFATLINYAHKMFMKSALYGQLNKQSKNPNSTQSK